MSTYKESSPSIVKKFLAKWPWFVLCLAVMLAYTKYSLLKARNVYQTTGTVIMEEEKEGAGQMPEELILQGLPFRNKGNLDRTIQILKSKNLMKRVVDSLNLDVQYFLEMRFKMEELYKISPVRVAEIADISKHYGKNIRVKTIDDNRFAIIKGEKDTVIQSYGLPFSYDGMALTLVRDTMAPPQTGVISIYFTNPGEIAKYFSYKLIFQKLGMSNILELSMNDEVPAKVTDLIVELVEVFNAYTEEEKNKKASRSLAFIEDRLSKISSELFAVEGRQAAVKSSSDVPNDIATSADRLIEKLNTADASRSQINSVKASLYNLQSLLSENDVYEAIPNFGELVGLQISPLITQYNEVVTSRQRKLISSTPKHPDIVKANTELTKMRSTMLSGINLALQDLSRKEQQLTTESAPMQQKLGSLPFAQQKITQITRQVDVKKDLVIYMLQKREETAIGMATHSNNARILDAPVSSGVPISPNPSQSFILAIAMGLALPASVIYLLTRLNDKVQNKSQIKSLVSVPFLGEVSYAKSERSKIISNTTRSAQAEMFRLIRTNLQFLTVNAKNKTILVTSMAGGDGKTFISGNLGACLALADSKTVIIELDLRKPKLTEFVMKKPSTIGVTNYLVGEKSLKDILQPVEDHKGLYLISSGPTPPNPAELLMSDRMVQLMEELQKDFDCIVMDTPPTGVVADAFLLNKFATCVVFVARFGKTRKDDLKAIEDTIKEGKVTNGSILLNGVKTPKRYGYYY